MTFAFKVKETLNTDANWLFLSATCAKMCVRQVLYNHCGFIIVSVAFSLQSLKFMHIRLKSNWDFTDTFVFGFFDWLLIS